MGKVKVLYVEDELNLATIVLDTLKGVGYEVELVSDGALVMEQAVSYTPDICVLDIMLPNVDGFELGKLLRAQLPELPILYLTARAELEDLVKGFRSGGNDYLKKPFSMEELIVRIDNLIALRSGVSKSSRSGPIAVGSYSFDLADHTLTRGDEIRNLSYREVEVLEYCCHYMNGIIQKKDILIAIWGDDSYYNSRNLDVYMKKLRTYLAADEGISIITLRGVGYKFKVDL